VTLREILADGWENVLTGLGTTADKLRSTVWVTGAQPVEDPDQYEEIYETMWLARRVVQVLPEHALRKRPEIKDFPEPETLWEKWDALNVTDLYPHGVFAQALFQGRLHGGAVLIPGFRYGNPWDPAPEPGPRSEILWLDVVRWADLRIVDRETDANSPRYGQPSVFEVQGDHVRRGHKFHASRAIFCEGAPRARARRSDLTPWLSVLDPVIEELKRYDTAWQSVGHLLDEASIGVLELAGLIGMLGQKDQSVVEARMRLMTQGRSVARTVFLDAAQKEKFSRTEVSFASIPQLLEQAALQVSGATEIPVAILLGQEPAGMNATGENDRAQFDDRVAVYGRSSVLPKQMKLLSWINGAPVKLEAKPVREMTDAEQADLRKTEAETLHIFWQDGVMNELDVVKQIADDYDLDVDAKEKELEESAATEAEQAAARADALAAAQAAQGNQPPPLPGQPPKPPVSGGDETTPAA
jgi:phage-related protein (TIGR01555 family)